MVVSDPKGGLDFTSQAYGSSILAANYALVAIMIRLYAFRQHKGVA